MRYLFITLLVILGSVMLVGPAFGYVASSSSYRLEKDSINFAGTRSTSASYTMEDTVGEIGTGTSTSNNFNIHAGYQAMESDGVSVSISLSSPSNITMSPSIDGTTGGESDGSATWTVTTNNLTGYSLSVKAATNPALKSGSDSFTDYTPAGVVPDFSFNVGVSSTGFGFSPEGVDLISTYQDNGVACGVGSSDTTNACWQGFDTSGKTVATSNAANNPTGTATTLKLKAKVGSSISLPAGSYNAVITATALTL